MRARELLVAGAATALAAVAVSSCSTVNPEAARVGATTISQRDFEDDVNAFIHNESFVTDAASAFPGIDTAAHDGSVTARLSRTLLTIEIDHELVHTIIMAKGLAISGPAEAAVAQQVIGLSNATWSTLPARLRNAWATSAAEQLLLQQTLNGPPPTEAEIQAFYDQVKDQLNGATIDQVRSRIVDRLEANSNWNGPYQQAISDAEAGAHIRVDPRYGIWDGGAHAVAPLTPPRAGSDKPARATTVDTPGAASTSTTAAG